MKLRRGDIVLVDYPYSDRTGSKVRPCLVVQCDRNNNRLDDTIVVTITGRIHHAGTEPTQLLIDPGSAEGRQSGLLARSAVQCENILTIDTSFVMRKTGEMPDGLMAQVNGCLRAALEIS